MYSKIVCFLILIVCFSSCNRDDNKVLETEAEEEQEELVIIIDTDFEDIDQTDATHSKSTDPDFSEFFDDTAVKRLGIQGLLKKITSYGTSNYLMSHLNIKNIVLKENNKQVKNENKIQFNGASGYLYISVLQQS